MLSKENQERKNKFVQQYSNILEFYPNVWLCEGNSYTMLHADYILRVAFDDFSSNAPRYFWWVSSWNGTRHVLHYSDFVPAGHATLEEAQRTVINVYRQRILREAI